MHILLVEDNEDMRLATGGLLETAGHSVQAVVDAEEALAVLAVSSDRDRFSNQQKPVEAIVTDIDLPGMSGTDLLRRLIGEGSTLPLAAVSSLHRFEALEELDASGRVSFVRKPFSAAQLEQALTEAKAGSKKPVSGLKKAPRPRPSPREVAPAPVRVRFFWGIPLLVLLFLGMGLLWKMYSAPPRLPEAPTSTAQRGDRILLEAPRGEISEVPAQLSWQPTEAARSYRVFLMAVDDSILWQEVVAQPTVPLPAAIAEALERAVVYHWKVDGLDAQGRPVARSEVGRFLLRLEPRSVLPADPSLAPEVLHEGS